MKRFVKLLPVVALLCWLFSCNKESFSTDPSFILRTSEDTLHFDTVFTSTGSVSQFVKIINDNKQGINVSSIRLAGGPASPFRINVDGLPGPSVSDLKIAGYDSAYIYVTVTINPNAANLPFIVQDSIEINYNGNKQFVQLQAFGQNAVFLRNKIVSINETWNNRLPYVLLGQVTITPGATLNIDAGTRVHLHADAPIFVQGTLRVNGTKDARVIFASDRLDEPYRDFPASHPGLIFTETSRDNVLNYAVIKNAYQGIVAVGLPPSGTKVTLNQTIIDNAYAEGILAINTSIAANNLLVSNCGQNINLLGGGPYNFIHCTSVAYSNAYVPHQRSVVTVVDTVPQPTGTLFLPVSASFTNCILWGEANGFVDDEALVIRKGTQPFSATFNRVLWRMKNAPPSVVSVLGTALNTDPKFDSINTSKRYFDFRLQTKGSPAVDAGVNTTLSLDLDGNMRPRGAAPDLGAYEKQ